MNSGEGVQASLEVKRQQLLRSTIATNEDVTRAISIFGVARELVPLPIATLTEPVHYSTSSGKGN